jgi:hypothetical protein
MAIRTAAEKTLSNLKGANTRRLGKDGKTLATLKSAATRARRKAEAAEAEAAKNLSDDGLRKQADTEVGKADAAKAKLDEFKGEMALEAKEFETALIEAEAAVRKEQGEAGKGREVPRRTCFGRRCLGSLFQKHLSREPVLETGTVN